MSADAKHSRLPTPPASLDDAAAERLSQLVLAALRHQRHAAAEAIEHTTDHVPRVLRMPVKKILGI